MNSHIFLRRDAIATALLTNFMTEGKTVLEAIPLAMDAADKLIAELDRTASVSADQLREALGHISDIIEEKAIDGDDLEIGSTAFKSVRRWARVGQKVEDPVPVSDSPKCAIAHNETNAPSFRQNGSCKVCGSDWPEPVSPPALPLCPEHISRPPEDCVYWGNRPLDVFLDYNDLGDDVFCLDEDTPNDIWESPASGESDDPHIHYALRRGSAIARANGIPD